MEYDFSIRELRSQPQGLYRVSLFSKDEHQLVGEHTVHVDAEYITELGFLPEKVSELLRVTFEFLLQREPPESILKEFDLRVVARYFPEYEETMRNW